MFNIFLQIDDDDEEAEAMIRACQVGDVDLDLASQVTIPTIHLAYPNLSMMEAWPMY